jgi:RNA polymerase sigma-70 factor (ECF subfamily)
LIEDRMLVEQAQNGNRNAFRQLVERHKERVYYIALDLMSNRSDAEDMSQEAFIKAYKSLHRFRGDAQFSSWLYRITVNTCIDHRRKKWWRIRKAQAPMNQEDQPRIDRLPSGMPGPEESAQEALVQAQLRDALDQLPQRERDVFVLRHDHDLPLKEIAETLGISLGTVKSTLFSAVRRLRDQLSDLRDELGWET